MPKNLIWDIETDGLLPELTRVHCLVVRDAATRETWRFRRREAHPAYECNPLTKPGVLTAVEAEDTIADGLKMLEDPEATIIGHNIIGFDLMALKKVYPDFRPQSVVRDTLTLMRIIEPDLTDRDVRLMAKGTLPGKFYKKHSLDAWGHRTGTHKGSYMDEMLKLGKSPWAAWNADMEEYCVGDVDATEAVLHNEILPEYKLPVEQAQQEEHDIDELCSYMRESGFPFDIEGSRKLRDELQSAYYKVVGEVKDAFGSWYKPEKKHKIRLDFDLDVYLCHLYAEYKWACRLDRVTYEEAGRLRQEEMALMKRRNPRALHEFRNLILALRNVYADALHKGIILRDHDGHADLDYGDAVLPRIIAQDANNKPYSEPVAKDLLKNVKRGPAVKHMRVPQATDVDNDLRLLPDADHYVSDIPLKIDLKVLIDAYWQCKKPRPEFGEDYSRPWWGEVTVPKRTARVRSYCPPEVCPPEGEPRLLRTEGVLDPETGIMQGAYCKRVREEFNPGSRHHIVDRLYQVCGWYPQTFTEKGNPQVSGDILRAAQIPIATKIAAAFFLNKYLGQIANGANAWMKKYNPDTGAIHCYTNVGGTVSGRCSHIAPNLGQVPSVLEAPVRLKDGAPNPTFLSNGSLLPLCFDFDGKERVEAGIPGIEGEYGVECRRLFRVPEGWVQVGVDLSGIEFRCLAELVAEFDKGELIEVIKSGQDIHAYNQQKTGIKSRNIIKRCLYGLMYGAGDYKLGITADPTLTMYEERAKTLGREIRAQIMQGLPALAQVIKMVQLEAESGQLIGLDGRRLHCRHAYSALNLRLQGNAALLAKKWMVLTERNALKRGWDHGWSSDMNPDGRGDFAMMAFVHDEMQNAVRPELMRDFGQLAMDAALETGRHFKFACPIEAKAKFGRNWAECH